MPDEEREKLYSAKLMPAEKLCDHVALIRSGKIIRQEVMSVFMKELDHQVIALTLENPIDKLPKISIKNIKLIDRVKVQVDISKDQHLSDVISILNRHNIRVINIEQKVSQLEYYFLRDMEGVNL